MIVGANSRPTAKRNHIVGLEQIDLMNMFLEKIIKRKKINLSNTIKTNIRIPISEISLPNEEIIFHDENTSGYLNNFEIYLLILKKC